MIDLTITQNAQDVAQYLIQGRLVAFPTGTSYGLAADALQGWALQRLRNLKQRPPSQAFSIMLDPTLWPIYLKLTDQEQHLMHVMQGQPLTIVVNPQPTLSHNTIDGQVAVRLIDHPLMAELARIVAVPLTATSANRHSQPPATSPKEIMSVFSNPLPDDQLEEEDPRGSSNTTYDLSLAAILDGGQIKKQPPTTIVRLAGKSINILRAGTITREELESQFV